MSLLNFKSYACFCNVQSFEKVISWADEIFIGRLIQVKEVYSYTNEQDPSTK